jgi:hypothetical protein
MVDFQRRDDLIQLAASLREGSTQGLASLTSLQKREDAFTQGFIKGLGKGLKTKENSPDYNFKVLRPFPTRFC